MFGGDSSGTSHWGTSYLSTIQPKKTRYGRNPRNNFSLLTNDIGGAQSGTTPSSRINRFKSRNYSYNIKDIEGTSPKRNIPLRVNKKNTFNIRNDDIEGSKPRNHLRMITRHVNPLNPVYNLPKVKTVEAPPPKFIRDTLNYYQDITKVRRKKLFAQPRENLKLPEKSSGKKFYRKSNPNLEVKDINNYRVFRSKRKTNPLSPRYKYDVPPKMNPSNKKGEWTIGDVKGSKPRKAIRETVNKPELCLRTDDINRKGEDHYHNVPKSFPKERRQFRKINYIKDIEGAHPKINTGTFHIQTKRQTNPLNPNY